MTDDDDVPVCPHCGTELDWVDCWEIGCDGGWWFCPDDECQAKHPGQATYARPEAVR